KPFIPKPGQFRQGRAVDGPGGFFVVACVIYKTNDATVRVTRRVFAVKRRMSADDVVGVDLQYGVDVPAERLLLKDQFYGDRTD
ncbi:hypothetical protein, partial [Beijerinckia sp. L45]|uniref:hypothetical protein n=1 Tax=Beijerinckia sp. L45 TaxID=1641855 RepID=UPI00131A8614